MSNFQDVEQYPLNVVGPKGQHGFMGTSTSFFEGATGLIGTTYGIPGVTMTRVATGAYRVNFPSSPQVSGAMGVTILPGLNAPSGNFYDVNVSDVNSVTGVAHIQIAQFSGTGTGVVTQMMRPANPVSGTKLHLQFFVSPITPF